jgi:TetR/AcrR family transcriptional repressor of nem operon
MTERTGRKKVFPAIVTQYLSAMHRDAAGQGCVVAALGSEIARQPDAVRDAFTREFKNSLQFLAELMGENNPSRSNEDAIAAFASMVGALILARAVNDEPLSNQILKSTAKRVIRAGKARRNVRRSRAIAGRRL